MRPRLGSAHADSAAHATADPRRWTHGVGVADRARFGDTPTSNAIGLSRPKTGVFIVANGRLSPWRCNLPPRSCLGVASAQGEEAIAARGPHDV